MAPNAPKATVRLKKYARARRISKATPPPARTWFSCGTLVMMLCEPRADGVSHAAVT